MENIDKVCFFIAPIGDEGTEIRKRSDGIYNCIIRPVAEQCGYRAVRADEISKSGRITTQIVCYLFESAVVIADLTDGNPNVFYELGIRHTFEKPYVQLIQKGQRIPFDLVGERTIYLEYPDWCSIGATKKELVGFIQSEGWKDGETDNPVTVALKTIGPQARESFRRKKPVSDSFIKRETKKLVR